MTTRILPHEEWPRLTGTYLEPLWPLLKPDTCSVLVVEEDGEIVGTWALMSVMHVEGFSAKNGAVFRALLRGMKVEANKHAVTTVMTASVSDKISEYLHRLDAGVRTLEGTSYVWTLPTV